MTGIDVIALILFAALSALVIAAMIVNAMLAARIGRIKERGELRGYRFKMFKFVPQALSFTWGFTPWDLGDLIEQVRSHAQYREELTLARWLVALYVAGPATGVAIWILLAVR